MQNFINKFESRIKEFKVNEGDYQENGVWCCGKCKTPRQVIGMTGRLIPVNCDCEQEEYLKESKIKKHNDFLKRYETYIYDSYKGTLFKDVEFCNDDEYRFAKNYVENFRQSLKDNIGLYVYGDFGNGKTTITKAIANELMEKEFIVVMYPCNLAIDKFNEFKDFKDKVRDCDLLILDDFGSNRMTDFQVERLQNLIDYRYEIKKPLIVTTNIDRRQLDSPDNPTNLKRIYNRIIEMTFGVEIKVSGKRKELARDKMKNYKDIILGDN